MSCLSDYIRISLSKKYDVTLYGKTERITLKRPRFYTRESEITIGHIYIGSTDMLPVRPDFNSNTMIVCVGSLPSRQYAQGRFPVIHIHSGDMIQVFNEVQTTFDRLESWEKKMQAVVNSTASIVDLTQVSIPVFQNPIYIFDSKLQYLALAPLIENKGMPAVGRAYCPSGIMEEELFRPFMEKFPVDMTRREVFMPDEVVGFDSSNTLCKNIYSNEIYYGSISIRYEVTPIQEEHYFLLETFANYVAEALKKRTEYSFHNEYTLRNLVFDLLHDNAINEKRIQLTLSRDTFYTEDEQKKDSPESYYCLKLTPRDMHVTPNNEYVCNFIEQWIPGSAAVRHDGCIVCLLRLESGESIEGIIKDLSPNMEQLGFQGSFSYSFKDVMRFKTYYRQAVITYDLGRELDPDADFWCFEDYLLSYLLINCGGDFSFRDICPPNIQHLMEIDKERTAEYWHTLEVCIDNNFHISQAARELFLHRSTLLARLERIHEILGMDFEDAGQRLLLSIFVKWANLESPYNLQSIN